MCSRVTSLLPLCCNYYYYIYFKLNTLKKFLPVWKYHKLAISYLCFQNIGFYLKLLYEDDQSVLL